MPERPAATFSLPGNAAGRNAVNLYLASIVENAELRSDEPEYERSEFGFIALKPPLRLKCTYIISVWPSEEDREKAALIEHELLSEVYRVFTYFSKLPSAFIPESMRADDLPAPVLEIPKGEFQNKPEFWTSAGCTFHTAFSCTATVSLPAIQESYDHMVEKVQVGYKLK